MQTRISIILLVIVTIKFYHTFNICFTLKNPLHILKSITLRSVEILVVLHNISPVHGSSTISFKFTYSTLIKITKTVLVTTAAYTGVKTISAAINTAVGNAIVPYGSLTVSFI